jgi:hypothetical protein
VNATALALPRASQRCVRRGSRTVRRCSERIRDVALALQLKIAPRCPVWPPAAWSTQAVPRCTRKITRTLTNRVLLPPACCDQRLRPGCSPSARARRCGRGAARVGRAAACRTHATLLLRRPTSCAARRVAPAAAPRASARRQRARADAFRAPPGSATQRDGGAVRRAAEVWWLRAIEQANRLDARRASAGRAPGRAAAHHERRG